MDDAVELLGLFSSVTPDDAGCELLAGADEAGVEVPLEADVPEEVLPELAGASGIPAQDVRIIADITAAAAVTQSIRRAFCFRFIMITLPCLPGSLSAAGNIFDAFSLHAPASAVNEKNRKIQACTPDLVTALQNWGGMLDKGERTL